MAASSLLQHRGIVLVDPGLLPALVPDGWQPATEARGVRLVHVGGTEEGTRPFLLAPSEDPAGTLRKLAQLGAAAFLYVGTCASPTRALEPGEVLVVEAARTSRREVAATPPLAQKLANRCERRGVAAKRGVVASGGRAASGDEAGEDARCADVLEAGEAMDVATAALLVCTGAAREAGTEAPAALLEGFDRAFGVLQEVLGSDRSV